MSLGDLGRSNRVIVDSVEAIPCEVPDHVLMLRPEGGLLPFGATPFDVAHDAPYGLAMTEDGGAIWPYRWLLIRLRPWYRERAKRYRNAARHPNPFF